MVVAPTAPVSLAAPPAPVLPGDETGGGRPAFAQDLGMDPAAGRR